MGWVYRLWPMVLVLFILFLLSGAAVADGENVTFKDGALVINAHGNHFANIVYYPGLKAGAYKEASFETKIRGGAGGGTSYEPGLFLYWRSTNKWVSIRFVSQYYVVEGNMGKWFRYRDSSLKSVGSWGAPGTDEDWLIPDRDEWSGFKIVLTPKDMRFYVTYLDEDWYLLCTLERVIADEEPYIIVGKGSPGREDYTPYFANSYPTDTGSFRPLYIDDVIVKVDGKIILQDAFDGEELGKHWTLLLNGDPDLENKIKALDLMAN